MASVAYPRARAGLRPVWWRARAHGARRLGAPIATLAALCLIYEALLAAGVFDSRYLPHLAAIVVALVALVGDAAFWRNAGATWSAAAAGFAIGVAIAVPAGLVAGRNRVVWHALRPLVDFLRPMPTVAMIPLVVMLWGPSIFSKAFLAAFTTLWPVFIQTAYGVRETHPTAVDTARSFGLGGGAILRRIVLPSALPGIATAIRIQASIALLVTITAEVALGGGGGLGILVFQLDQAGDYAGMYALILFIGAQGMAVGSSLAAIERRTMPWIAVNRVEQGQ